MARTSKSRYRTNVTRDGVGIDRSGGPAIDPTENVVALVESEARAAAALREADIKFNDRQHCHLKEVTTLLSKNAETLRVSDLDRLDKTRQVDVLAAAASAATLATAVQTLATTSDRNAETLRTQLNADRAALAKQMADAAVQIQIGTDNAFKDVNARIAELQKSQYQGAGKSSVADPIMSEFMIEMKKMASAVQERRGHESVSDPALTAALTGLASGQMAMAASISGLKTNESLSMGRQQGVMDSRQLLTWGLGILAVLTALYTFSQRQSTPTTPQIIVVPAGTQTPGAVTGPSTQTVPK